MKREAMSAMTIKPVKRVRPSDDGDDDGGDDESGHLSDDYLTPENEDDDSEGNADW